MTDKEQRMKVSDIYDELIKLEKLTIIKDGRPQVYISNKVKPLERTERGIKVLVREGKHDEHTVQFIDQCGLEYLKEGKELLEAGEQHETTTD